MVYSWWGSRCVVCSRWIRHHLVPRAPKFAMPSLVTAVSQTRCECVVCRTRIRADERLAGTESDAALLAALARNGLVLHTVPDERITPEMCALATQQDRAAYAYVPRRFRTPKLRAQLARDYAALLARVPPGTPLATEASCLALLARAPPL